MAEYIACRSCESPDCKGCNLKRLETMLENGKFDCLMNENRCINTSADVEPVQKWVSVKDMLPDLISCNVGTAYSEAVIAWTSGRKVMIAVWDGIDWIAPFDYWEAWGEEITHWMPLPPLPKGE